MLWLWLSLAFIAGVVLAGPLTWLPGWFLFEVIGIKLDICLR